ncbi:MAG: hypothetical protein ACLQJR_09185 [Stellaceae bacterium]
MSDLTEFHLKLTAEIRRIGMLAFRGVADSLRYRRSADVPIEHREALLRGLRLLPDKPPRPSLLGQMGAGP